MLQPLFLSHSFHNQFQHISWNHHLSPCFFFVSHVCEEKKGMTSQEITRIEVYSDIDIDLCYDKTGNNETLRIVSDGSIRCSVIDSRLTIESLNVKGEAVIEMDEVDDTLSYRVKNIIVKGKGCLSISPLMTNRCLTVKILDSGGLIMNSNEEVYFISLKLENHDSGNINGFGARTESLKIISTRTGKISKFLVEKKLSIILSGSGDISLDKFPNCYCNVQRIRNSSAIITWV